MLRLISAATLVLGILLLPGAFAAKAADTRSFSASLEPFGYERIELRRTSDNHLYLSGKLNGRRRSVLVDTAWSFTTVSTNAATGNRMDRLQLGASTFTNEPALVQHLTFNGKPAPFDVVLGCDFLLRHFAVIDCANRRLHVRRAAPTEQEQRDFDNALRRAGFQEVELKRKSPLAITCPVRVNGEAIEMLVDTAAPWSCLDLRLGERLGLKPVASPAKVTGVGRAGTRGVAVAEVKSLRVGEAEMRKINLALFDLGDWGFAAPDAALSEVQGILGGDVLNLGGAVIDCGALKLWMKRAG